jgi:dipeptidyl aminopeptidase/acylaminoacyl peptidase
MSGLLTPFTDMTYRLPRLLLLCGLLVTVSTPVQSQAPVKRPLTHKDYTIWRSIQSPAIAPDGSHVAYAVAPQDGDGEFIVRHLASGKEYRHSRGSRGPTLPTPPAGGTTGPRRGPGPGPGLPVGGGTHLFSPDSKTVLFPIYPTRDRSKGKATPTPGGGMALGIMDLAGGKVTKIERVRGYTVPEEGPAIVVYQRESATPTKSDPTKGSPTGATTPTTPRMPSGSELVLRNLNDGKERTFADVGEYSLTRDGKLLVYTVIGKKDDGHGVYAASTTKETPPVAVRVGGGRYSRLTWDQKQTQIVFFQAKSASGASPGTPAELRICHWKRPSEASAFLLPTSGAALTGLGLIALQAGTPGATDLVPTARSEWKPGMQLSDQGGLSFSLDGTQVYFSLTQPPPPPNKPRPGEQKAVVELWHYKDDFIQPMQKVRYNARPSYRAVVHLADGSSRQLTDETITQVQPAPVGEWAIALDDRPYRTLVGSQEVGFPADSYLLNSKTGDKKLLTRKQVFPPSFSPGGKYLLSFNGKDWLSRSVPDGKPINLTAKLGVSFVNELHDQPGNPPSYGFASWTADDRHVLLYDRYDIWLVAADGSGAKNLTANIGRKAMTQLRIVRLDRGERGIDPNKPLLVRAENEATRDTGFYRLSPTAATPPKLLIMGARNYGSPIKAARNDQLLLTISTFYDYSDIYCTDSDFQEIKKVSDANPQKANFVWGKAELLKYKNADGVNLQGVLIKPENFDPNKKYPMLVYIYERLSQNVHRFVAPNAGTSINPTYYASNGYLVLMPDIAYTVGYPGQSAVKCVLPAIQAVIDQGCVDEKAIGIQGHSWGGYQTAYLITQTTRFKAAAAGAPVSNMTSAYGGIRWGSGLPRQFQYEKTQSRIGGTLWQYPTRFLENSPLFYADRIKTPLMMLHNDRDEAVPWQQGIEYYLALRRLGKEVYLFNYPGEFHGLRQRNNQLDYTVRMQQFFDHHLKGAAKPTWMAKGEPYTPPPGGETTPAGRRGRFGTTTTTTPPATTEPE